MKLYIILSIFLFMGSAQTQEKNDTAIEATTTDPPMEEENVTENEESVKEEENQTDPPHEEVYTEHIVRNLKNLIFRKKPINEGQLNKRQKKILNAADGVFAINHDQLPVKGLTTLDETSSEEIDQVVAFELLSAMVSRTVRDTIICSTIDDRVFNSEEACSDITFDDDGDGKVKEEDGVVVAPNVDPQCMHGAHDGSSEECRKQHELALKTKKKSAHRGRSLDFQIFVRNTGRPSYKQMLPSDGMIDNIKGWDKNSPTKIICILMPYEFYQRKDHDKYFIRNIISALNEKYGNGQNHNIVELQWPEVWVKKLKLLNLATRFDATAESLSRMISRWHRKGLVDLEKVHIISFSLGAHLAGSVADKVKLKTGGKRIGRITGLDPLSWGFDEVDEVMIGPGLELGENDASFVDVIHTSAPDPNFPYIHYGTNENRGTADFYPNNGRAPYCAPLDGLCHHFYSITLYIASMKPGQQFIACHCKSWEEFIRFTCLECEGETVMGENMNMDKSCFACLLFSGNLVECIIW